MRAALDQHGPLCVGIDPHAALLDAWGLGQDADGVREFGLRTVQAAAGRVAVVKPQVSFFERFGSRGFAALEEVLAAARAAGLLVLSDAKRGDIGTTMDGYADAWLAPGAPLESDAVTLSPYLGADSLRDVLTGALRQGKGAFVLAATSNPEGEVVQRARTCDTPATPQESVAQRVARDVTWLNPSMSDDPMLGSIGLVIGATVDLESFGLVGDALRSAPILAPGFGVQGAGPEHLVTRFGAVAGNVLASESRSILSAGPDGLVEAIESRAAQYREVLHG
nr:orotidine-5'-phosphate decarboxylase [Microbacterium pseudoresistens]